MDVIVPFIVKEPQSGQRLDLAISKVLSHYSRSQIKRWIISNKIKVNGRIVDVPKKKVMVGELIEIQNIFPVKTDLYPQNIFLDIVYEDDCIVLINKPDNMLVHPGAGHHFGTILNALLYRYPFIVSVPRAGIVHRLDKNTTGLMVVAKNIFSYNFLLRLFKDKRIVREYEAIVLGTFLHTQGTIDAPIRRHIVHRTRMAVHDMGKSSITHYSVIEKFHEKYTRIRVWLETGRTHQIRVHMAYIDHPIIGDQKYGRLNFFYKNKDIPKKLFNYLRYFNRQALHASTLHLYHPITQKKMKWSISLPQDILNLIKILRENEMTK